MKWFYVTALLAVGLLGLAPFFLLPAEQEDQYAGKVVDWDTYGSAVKSVDPATCSDTMSIGILANVHEGLYCYHYLKRPPTVIPQLAAAMPEVSPDGLTYTIRLKRGVEYHRNPCFGVEGEADDGRFKTRTVKAEDFILALKRCADYHINSGLSWAFLSNRVAGLDDWRAKSKDYASGDFSRYDLPVEGLKALDQHTLQIKLRRKFPQLTYVLAMSVYAPVPREAVEYWLATEDDGSGGRRKIALTQRCTEFREAEQVVGTGPYRLKTFERKKKIVLVRNPYFRPEYYPTEGEPGDREAGLLDDAGERVPFIDVIHLNFVAEDYSAWMQFLSKQRDLSGIPRETFEFVITPDRELAEVWRKRRVVLHKYWSPSIYWICFNMEDPVVGASKSLRQAMCLAFDVESYVKVLYNGRGRRAVNIIPSSFPGWKQAGPGPYYRLDVAAAKAKLPDARKELAAAGQLRNGQIPELKIDLGGRDQPAVRQGVFFQQQFRKVGLKVKISYNDWPTLQKKVHNKVVQIYTMGWHADYPDPENFLQLFYSPNIKKGTNNTNYSNPEFDRLYEKVRVMDDTPERLALYVKMIRMISEDVPVLLLSEPQSFLLSQAWVGNIKPHPLGYGFSKYRRIDVELREKLGGR